MFLMVVYEYPRHSDPFVWVAGEMASRQAAAEKWEDLCREERLVPANEQYDPSKYRLLGEELYVKKDGKYFVDVRLL